MTKKKDVVQKFKTFFTRLSPNEQRTLYDILSVLRGPDDLENQQTYIKYDITCKIRSLVCATSFYTFFPGIDEQLFDPIVLLVKKYSMTSHPEDHYKMHAYAALRQLHDLGYVP